jgi:hypothetical protein
MRNAPMIWILVAACGGSDDLDPAVVTNLPAGDATGTAATGTWEMESITTACGGTCVGRIDGVTFSACDIGTRLDETAEVTQSEGALVLDIADSEYVSRLAGGIDADGGYEVGGLRTLQGGSLTITARSIGTLAGDTMTGSARLHASGSGLDCTIEVDVDGTR